jgi:hypothetical protein
VPSTKQTNFPEFSPQSDGIGLANRTPSSLQPASRVGIIDTGVFSPVGRWEWAAIDLAERRAFGHGKDATDPGQ